MVNGAIKLRSQIEGFKTYANYSNSASVEQTLDKAFLGMWRQVLHSYYLTSEFYDHKV
jgi:hypothetical protein